MRDVTYERSPMAFVEHAIQKILSEQNNSIHFPLNRVKKFEWTEIEFSSLNVLIRQSVK